MSTGARAGLPTSDNWPICCHSNDVSRPTGPALLATDLLKRGHPAGNIWWPTLGILAIAAACFASARCVLAWDAKQRRSRRQASSPELEKQTASWARVSGWTLIIAGCVGVTWAVSDLAVSAGLTLAVTAFAAILPALFVLWYTVQKDADRSESPVRGSAAASQRDPLTGPEQDGGQSNSGVRVSVLPGPLDGASGAEPASPDDTRRSVAGLQANVAALRRGVLEAIVAYGPIQDWRLLLAEPLARLGTVNALLDQISEEHSEWGRIGAGNFAFTDTWAAARRTAARLGEAIGERTAGRPIRIDLGQEVRRLDDLTGQLAELLETAIQDP